MRGLRIGVGCSNFKIGLRVGFPVEGFWEANFEVWTPDPLLGLQSWSCPIFDCRLFHAFGFGGFCRNLTAT